MDGIKDATKHDAGKLRYDLVPYEALDAIVEVLAVGAVKYGDRNWEKGLDWSRPFSALQRHITAWWKGEDKDPETQLSHLAHAGCNILFLLAFELRKAGVDNRPDTQLLKLTAGPFRQAHERSKETQLKLLEEERRIRKLDTVFTDGVPPSWRAKEFTRNYDGKD